MQIDGYSLEAQKTKMKAFCDCNEYEIASEYEDAGKSGKSIEGRIAFKIPIGTCFHMIFITSNSALEICGKSLISNPSQMIQREFSRVDQGPFR